MDASKDGECTKKKRLSFLCDSLFLKCDLGRYLRRDLRRDESRLYKIMPVFLFSFLPAFWQSVVSGSQQADHLHYFHPVQENQESL